MASARDSIREYLGYGGVDHLQRTLHQSLSWDDEMLENTHDYIQWWFPLTEPSAFNVHAPVATYADFEYLASDELVRLGVEQVTHRISRFYGLRFEASGVVRKSDEWEQRSQLWAYKQNHNDLRITRILKSLCLLGHRGYARALLVMFEEIIREERKQSDQVPLRFWREALNEASLK